MQPTSGLDSFNALNVMLSLRHLCRNGRTVVTTIHQPRSNIFNLFDNLLLLSEGKTMYFGKAANAVVCACGSSVLPPRYSRWAY